MGSNCVYICRCRCWVTSGGWNGHAHGCVSSSRGPRHGPSPAAGLTISLVKIATAGMRRSTERKRRVVRVFVLTSTCVAYEGCTQLAEQLDGGPLEPGYSLDQGEPSSVRAPCIPLRKLAVYSHPVPAHQKPRPGQCGGEGWVL